MGTHKENIAATIAAIREQNPTDEIVIYCHPLEVTATPAIITAGVRVVKTKKVKLGKILFCTVPAEAITFPKQSILKQCVKKFLALLNPTKRKTK